VKAPKDTALSGKDPFPGKAFSPENIVLKHHPGTLKKCVKTQQKLERRAPSKRALFFYKQENPEIRSSGFETLGSARKREVLRLVPLIITNTREGYKKRIFPVPVKQYQEIYPGMDKHTGKQGIRSRKKQGKENAQSQGFGNSRPSLVRMGETKGKGSGKMGGNRGETKGEKVMKYKKPVKNLLANSGGTAKNRKKTSLPERRGKENPHLLGGAPEKSPYLRRFYECQGKDSPQKKCRKDQGTSLFGKGKENLSKFSFSELPERDEKRQGNPCIEPLPEDKHPVTGAPGKMPLRKSPFQNRKLPLPHKRSGTDKEKRKKVIEIEYGISSFRRRGFLPSLPLGRLLFGLVEFRGFVPLYYRIGKALLHPPARVTSYTFRCKSEICSLLYKTLMRIIPPWHRGDMRTSPVISRKFSTDTFVFLRWLQGDRDFPSGEAKLLLSTGSLGSHTERFRSF